MLRVIVDIPSVLSFITSCPHPLFTLEVRDSTLLDILPPVSKILLTC